MPTTLTSRRSFAELSCCSCGTVRMRRCRRGSRHQGGARDNSCQDSPSGHAETPVPLRIRPASRCTPHRRTRPNGASDATCGAPARRLPRQMAGGWCGARRGGSSRSPSSGARAPRRSASGACSRPARPCTAPRARPCRSSARRRHHVGHRPRHTGLVGMGDDGGFEHGGAGDQRGLHLRRRHPLAADAEHVVAAPEVRVVPVLGARVHVAAAQPLAPEGAAGSRRRRTSTRRPSSRRRPRGDRGRRPRPGARRRPPRRRRSRAPVAPTSPAGSRRVGSRCRCGSSRWSRCRRGSARRSAPGTAGRSPPAGARRPRPPSAPTRTCQPPDRRRPARRRRSGCRTAASGAAWRRSRRRAPASEAGSARRSPSRRPRTGTSASSRARRRGTSARRSSSGRRRRCPAPAAA